MNEKLRILNLEDSPNDAELIRERLNEEGIDCEIHRVDNKADFIAALDRSDIDLVLADYTLPLFDGMSALAISLKKCPDTPFIFVSGTIGEDVAIQALKNGATDYVIKSKLSRLAPAARRALKEAKDRAAHKLADEKLRESEDRYRSLFNNSIDAVMLTVPDGKILSANPAACRMFGRTEAEMCAIGRDGLVDSSDPGLRALVEERTRTGQASGELIFMRKDGSKFPAEVSSLVFEDKEGRLRTSMVVHDITEHKRAERELRKLNRVLQAKSRSSEAMMRASDELGYLNEACRIIVEDCGYALVWVGYAQNDEGKTVRPVAHAGFDEGYLESIQITWADVDRGRGPVGTAIRTGKLSLSRNILTTPGFAPWRDEALKRGYASVIGIPLLKDGKAFSSLNIYSREQDPFSENEVRLLSDLAADLSYGIDAIRLKTAQADAEIALRGSERRFRLLFENMLEGFAYCRMLYENGVPRDFIYLEVNGAFEKLTGLQNVIGKKISEVIPGIQESLPELFVIYGRVSLTGKPERFETFSEKFGGWLSISVYRTGKDHFVAVFDNITERKRVEEAIIESRNILSSVVENAPVRVFWKDAELRYLGCNTAFARDAGLSRPEDLIGKDDFQMVWREQAERYRADDKQVMDSDKKKIGYEEPQTTLDGQTIWLRTSKVPLHDKGGRVIGMMGMYEDVTERKQSEELLQEAERRYRLLFEYSPDGIVILDPVTAKPMEFNETAHRQLGYSREEFAQLSLGDVEAAETTVETRARIAKVIQKGKVDFETRHRTRQGEIRNVQVTAQIMDIQGHPVYHCIWRDITEHRKLEDQLRHAQKMEAIGQLAGGVAHDFNNILNVIMGYGSMIMEDLAPGSSSREQMHEVLAAAERAAVLTKRLLLFSRKQVAEVKPVEVNGIISGIQNMLSRIIGEDIELRVDLVDRPLTVMADSSQVEQVLMNLATNARDAMSKGGHLMITTETTHMDDDYIAAYGYGKVGAYALIVIADTGKGMDAETQKKIFEPFFTTKGIGEGTGLGLAIAYEIVKKHNGYIRCYSETGKGTAFKIYLPLIEDRGAAVAKIEASDDIKGGTETIFVAEDDASLRKLARLILESFGYHVIIAEDGEEAVAKYRENKDRIQLVILDLVMPKKNGKEAYEEIKAISPGVRAFFLSGYTMDMINRMEIEAGMEVIRKPFAPKELLKKVREVLDR